MPPSVDVFSPHHPLSFGSRGFDVLRGPVFLFPPVLTITRLRTFAAWGITATAGNDCPGADRKSFACFGQNFCGMCISPPDWRRRLWLSLAPGDRGFKRVNGTGHNNGQGNPPQRREARFAKRRCALHPGVFCRDARSAGHGATEAARPERSLQARGFHASDRSDSPKPRQRVRRRLAGAPAAACRSRA